MENEEIQKIQITVQITINAPIHKVWKVWSTTADILQWNAPSDDWLTSLAEIDFKEKGEFLFRMETKDRCFGFDHSGIYNKIIAHQLIEYTGHDGRKSIIKFIPYGGATHIVETFEADAETPIELQRDFCLGVLNNFKQHTENDTSK